MTRKATMRTSRKEKMITPKELHGNVIQPNRVLEKQWRQMAKVAAGGARGRGAKRNRRTRIRARITNGTVYTSYTIARADAFGEDG